MLWRKLNSKYNPLELGLSLDRSTIRLSPNYLCEASAIRGCVRVESKLPMQIEMITVKLKAHIKFKKLPMVESDLEQMELITEPTLVPQGAVSFPFELTISNQLPSNICTKQLQLNYSVEVVLITSTSRYIISLQKLITIVQFPYVTIPRQFMSQFTHDGTHHHLFDYHLAMDKRYFQINDIAHITMAVFYHADITIKCIKANLLQSVQVNHLPNFCQKSTVVMLNQKKYPTYQLPGTHLLNLAMDLPIESNLPNQPILQNINTITPNLIQIVTHVQIIVNFQVGGGPVTGYSILIPIRVGGRQSDCELEILEPELPRYTSSDSYGNTIQSLTSMTYIPPPPTYLETMNEMSNI